MARNGSGQYNSPVNTWNPPVNGVLATGTDFQAQLDDIAAALTQSVSADGQTVMTGSLPMNNNSITGVAAGTAAVPSISATSDANTGVYFPAADSVAISTGGTERARIDSSGNIGIGTTSPSTYSAKLAVVSTAADTRIAVVDDVANGRGGYLRSNYSDAVILGTTSGVRAIAFAPDNTERARIDSNGDLLVGTTSGYSSRVGISWDSSSQSGLILRTSSSTLTGSPVVFEDSGGTARGSISQTAISVSYNTVSDHRLKDNHQKVTGSGAFIDALQPKTWNWKIDGSRGVGFIAHEVQEVSPSSVVGEKDAVDEAGNPVIQTMEYGSAEFIANIVAELQQLRRRIAALEAE